MKKSIDLSRRSSALDITRIVALFTVISVHFFLNNGFYSEPMFGKRMLVMTVMRSAFMICVPLFIMLTGYLMSRKTLSRGYYHGIVKTLGIYLLASLACAVYKIVNLGYKPTWMIWGLFDYTTANYAWYIEMYIGLFLLIPFLNLAYNNLPSRKSKLVLLVTLIGLTSLPSIVNIYNFTVEGWWKTPYLSVEYRKFAPDWWTRIYPLTYYFLGAYLREFPLKLKQWQKLLCWLGCIIAFGLFNYYRSQYGFFAWSQYNDWQGMPNLVMTFFAFSFLSSIKTERWPNPVKRVLMVVSDLCLGGYLVSYIFDNLYYPVLAEIEPRMTHRLEWFIVIVPAVFLSSLALSGVLNLVYAGLARGGSALWAKIRPKRTTETASADNKDAVAVPVGAASSDNMDNIAVPVGAAVAGAADGGISTASPMNASGSNSMTGSNSDAGSNPATGSNSDAGSDPMTDSNSADISMSAEAEKLVNNVPALPTLSIERLETERLILREFRESDAEDVYEYARDPEVGPNAGWKPHESLDESRDVVKNFIQSGEVWAIEDKATHKVIGSIGLHKREREGYTFDRELGYALSRAYWGRGLMTEAASAIVDYAFAHGVKTLLVAHFDFNDRSRRVIEKLGFGKVGHAADSYTRYDGKVLSETIYIRKSV